MQALEPFFRNNMDFVFLVYGFSFVFMGIALFLRPKSDGQFKLAKVIWLLSLFAVLHGTNEWLDMLLLTHTSYNVLKVASLFFLVSSFCFLFEFGRKTLRICEDESVRKISQYLTWWLLPVLLATVFIVSFNSESPINTVGTLSRYFLALSGSFLTAIGLRLYCKETGLIEKLKVRKYFLVTITFFIVYGFLAGFVVPKSNFFPANIINTDAFLSFTGIPVQVFRALTAFVIAFSIIGVLKIFNYETKQKLQETIQELRLRQEDISQNARVHEVLNSILRVSLLSVSLRKQLEEILEILMSVPWLSLQKKGCIFLYDEKYNDLRIAAYHNLSDAHLSACATVSHSKCLCGLSASMKDVVFSSDSTDERHTIRYKNMEPHGHYCVPVILDEKLVGILTVYLNQGHIRNHNEEIFLKTVANTIAGIIVRKRSEQKIHDSALTQNVMNLILNVSLELIPLNEKLQKVLDIFSNVSWISATSSMGCIFIIEGEPEMLVMKAHRQMPVKVFSTCTHLPLGRCLCGTVAKTGKTIFKSSLDEDHDIVLEGVDNHGHYCIPIKSNTKVLGVINIYVKAGHQYDKLEETFLTSVADILASVIERKAVEDKIEQMMVLERSLQESVKNIVS
ncbi:MAG: GAF domain-containing protein [Nitrospirae bacterium]|nr:GAF domain-containing protein [Nitrospirota bacterium]